MRIITPDPQRLAWVVSDAGTCAKIPSFILQNPPACKHFRGPILLDFATPPAVRCRPPAIGYWLFTGGGRGQDIGNGRITNTHHVLRFTFHVSPPRFRSPPHLTLLTLLTTCPRLTFNASRIPRPVSSNQQPPFVPFVSFCKLRITAARPPDRTQRARCSAAGMFEGLTSRWMMPFWCAC